MQEWTKEDADHIYHVTSWGDGYFDISENGNLIVRPDKGNHSIEIKKVIDEMRHQGVTLPAVIRFHDVLRNQVKDINRTFRSVIEEADYSGRYFGVYPVKVNQMREVVEEIVDAGANYDYGLEAGSKPELLAALAYNTNQESLTILNGYKDSDYLRLALLGRKLGRKVIVVIEKYSELPKLLELSQELNVKPLIGLRVKMNVKHSGKWAESSGQKSKFGLNIPEVLNAIELMDKHGLKDHIKLFHFHIGSQISDIKTIKEAINEGGRVYTELVKLGCGLEYFDAGGGLGVDYDGSRSATDSSKNYTLKEYASDIVYGLKQICSLEKVAEPHIVTESGRAITAHHSCVITNVIDKIASAHTDYNTKKETGEHILVTNMRELSEEPLTQKNYQVTYNEALQLKDDSQNAFKLGILKLTERAKIDTLYWQIMIKINDIVNEEEFVPEGIYDLEDNLAPQYLCNFSVFQSAADHWAVDQLLPVVPISRLNEKPTLSCSIADITCDSDGKIDKFINRDELKNTVPLHKFEKNEDYLVGLFLTGAYQDVMGDMHNLFGRLNEVHVFSDTDDPQGFYIEEIIWGNTASAVLSTMQYNPAYMAEKLKKMVTKEVNRGSIPPREGVRLVDFYESCLTNYTYLMNEKKEQ